MSIDHIQLGRRALDCKGWRWMPGMAYFRFGKSHRIHSDILSSGGRYDETCVPDLTDPATLGCLLALVREAWFAEPGTVCWTEHKRKWVFLANEVHDDVIYGDSEPELLVNALESAP